jgi:hypothetical protein
MGGLTDRRLPIGRGWLLDEDPHHMSLGVQYTTGSNRQALYLVAGSAAQNGLRDSGPLGHRMRAHN